MHDIADRALVQEHDDLAARDFLVQLAQHLARDGVDDGDLVPADAHDAAGPDAIASRQVYDESGGVDVDDVPAVRPPGVRPRRGRQRRGGTTRRGHSGYEALHFVRAALTRTDASA